jgi:hypothetical protein
MFHDNLEGELHHLLFIAHAAHFGKLIRARS